MSERTGEGEGRGPGARLAAARESIGLTIFEVAERLHLDVGSLRALEAERFEIFGAAVFVRGHLRRYAELLGLPAGEIDAAYAACTRAPTSMPDLRRVATPLAEARSPVATPLRARTAVVGAVVLVVAALLWWAVRTPLALRSAPRGRDSASEEPLASDAAPPVPAVAPAPMLPEPSAAASSAELSVASVPPTAAVVAPAARTPPSANAAAGRPPPSPQVQLGLKFSQDSWTEIYDARGARLFYDLATAGSERHLSGVAPLRILLGNPEGVTLELDGRTVTLGNAAHTTPLRFALDGGGRVLEIPAAAPSQP